MLTAMQGAKIQAAVDLKEARNRVAGTMSYSFWTAEESRELSGLVGEIDKKIERIIPK